MVHHAFKKGTPILIIFKDGHKLIEKFIDNYAKGIICEHVKINYKDVRSITIYKRQK